MRRSSLGTFSLITLGAIALSASPGCENTDNGGGDGKVIHRDQRQTTTPDGKQVREREQVRQKSDGQTVKETETQTREPVAPGTTNTPE